MELALEVLLPAFVACLVLTGIHTYLGLHVVSRGVIFVDLALAQIAALGATFAFLLGYEPHSNQGYFYSLLFAVIGAAVFSISRLKDQRIPQEAIIGVTFAVASAAAILISDRAPHGAEHVEAMLTGAILWVPWPTILKTAAIYSIIGFFHWIYRSRFLVISLEPEKAVARGWNIRWWDFLFYTSFGLVITSSVAMAGILLVFSFLVIPTVIAMLFARSIGGRLAIGWTVGTLVSVIGLWLSYSQDFPSGPAVVVTFGCALILAAVGRYLMVSERRTWAVGKVVVTSAVVVMAFWLAFRTAEVSIAEHEEEHGLDMAGLQEPASLDPVERANRALAELEASEGPPPAATVARLLSVDIELHELMVTGQIQISEAAVLALGQAEGNGMLSHQLEEIAYHAPDPWTRLRGGQALVSRGNMLGVEALIYLLERDTPALVQLQAAEALREATGQDFGFDPMTDEEAMERAIYKWRFWMESYRGEPLPGRSEQE
jgi:zinc/manganese transport system permease protein